MGVRGAGLASMLTHLTCYVSYSLYFQLSKELNESWFLPNKKCLEGLREYFNFGVIGIFLVCAESWNRELMILITGYLSVDAQ